MAKESGRSKSTEQLKEGITASRESVARNLSNLRYELDVPRKIRRSVRRQPVLWIGGAIAIGVIVAALSQGRKIAKVAAKSAKPQKDVLAMGFALAALKIAAQILKPMAIKFVEKKMASRH
jgi:hypothetical protein